MQGNIRSVTLKHVEWLLQPLELNVQQTSKDSGLTINDSLFLNCEFYDTLCFSFLLSLVSQSSGPQSNQPHSVFCMYTMVIDNSLMCIQYGPQLSFQCHSSLGPFSLIMVSHNFSTKHHDKKIISPVLSLRMTPVGVPLKVTMTMTTLTVEFTSSQCSDNQLTINKPSFSVKEWIDVNS